MKSLLHPEAYGELTNRIQQLEPESKAQWGKMKVPQMLAHVSETYKIPLSDKPMPRMLLGKLIGWVFKPSLYNDKPWKQNLPTAPNFVIKDERDFNKELLGLLTVVETFHNSSTEDIGKYPHPMFGKFTTEQWGQAMYKHLDHHLVQFGV